MAPTKMELAELLSKAEGADADWLGEGVRVLAQALMDAEVSAQIGAEHGQRTPDRLTHRNGYRPREWDTRVGTIDLQIPRLRSGSYLPWWLEPRRRAERALCAVVAQCYVEGVSTRRVDDIARQMGIEADLQVAGQPDLHRARPVGRRLAQPAVGHWPVPVCVDRRAEHARARGGADLPDRGAGGHRL